MDRWDDLRYLVAIQKAGTMSGAARLLGANVGTVSRRIERLGGELGVQPFLKTPNGWQPNPELAGLIEAATDFENRIAVELNQRAERGVSRIALRMNCPPLVSTLFLFPGLGRLRDAHPELNVTITHSVFNSSLGENDVIVSSQLPERGRLLTRKTGYVDFALYHREGHVPDRDWIGLVHEHDETVAAQLGYGFFRCEPTVRLENYFYVADAVEVTNLPGVLPVLMAERRGGYVRVEPESTARVNLWSCYHETRKGDPAIEALITWIADCVSRLLKG